MQELKFFRHCRQRHLLSQSTLANCFSNSFVEKNFHGRQNTFLQYFLHSYAKKNYFDNWPTFSTAPPLFSFQHTHTFKSITITSPVQTSQCGSIKIIRRKFHSSIVIFPCSYDAEPIPQLFSRLMPISGTRVRIW